MTLAMSAECPFCWTPLSACLATISGMSDCSCERCGRYFIGDLAVATVKKDLLSNKPWKSDALSHAVHSLTERSGSKPLWVTIDLVNALLKEAKLATPLQQADNIILWLGLQAERQNDPAEDVEVPKPRLASIAGARTDTIGVALNALRESDLIRGSGTRLLLTLSGWERYAKLQTSKPDTRRAFMAMAFNDDMQHVFRECFRPAAADAGFDLWRLTDGQGAGLIDDQLRVALRTARFIIADLTSGNRGAYWEAGFAEGLGRPVIYVCEASIMEHPVYTKRPHFDTGHLLTVKWDRENLSDARERLAATIRNTFPSDATMPSEP